MPTPQAFDIRVSDDAIQDLNERLSLELRHPFNLKQHETSDKRKLGLDIQLFIELLDYWKNEFDWRKCEQKLNSFNHFKLNVNGSNIHYIHQCSTKPNAIPILLVHGWPGSVWEFLDMIPILCENGFNVIVPSIPGYGWSDYNISTGMNASNAASLFNNLMCMLGYNHYIAQGGDWGSSIVSCIATDFPRNCIALHKNMSLTLPDKSFGISNIFHSLQWLYIALFPSLLLSKHDANTWDNFLLYMSKGSGYFHEHMTKPHTIGVVLENSPVALSAWIFEKLCAWTDSNKSNIFSVLSKDSILANISIYWFTQTATSSVRFYADTMNSFKSTNVGYCSVPCGFAVFPREILNVPRCLVEYKHNIVHWKNFDKGGHFAAWEMPKDLAMDIIEFEKEVNFEKCKIAAGSASYGQDKLPFSKLVQLSLPIIAPAIIATIGGVILKSKL